jgi:hypothetical protein
MPASFIIFIRVNLTIQMNLSRYCHAAVIIAGLLASVSCGNAKKEMVRTWFITQEQEDETQDTKAASPGFGKMLRGSFVNLTSNDSCIYFFDGGYGAGTWQYEDRQLVISTAGKPVMQWTILERRGQHIKIEMKPTAGASLKVVLELEGEPNDYQNPGPFSPAYNQWRARATQKEDDAALRRRILNHTDNMIVYLKHIISKDADYLRVAHFFSPFKFYAYHAGLRPFEALHSNWKQLHYDSADVRRSYELIKRAWENEKTKPIHGDPKLKRYLYSLEQFRAVMDTMQL